MIDSREIKKMRKIFRKYGYTMKTFELSKEKIYYKDIQQSLEAGLIEKVKRGYYQWTCEYTDSDIMLLNKLFPDAVFCMETACFYYWYSDRTPSRWNFAIDRRVSKSRTEIDYPFIKVYRMEQKLLALGVTKHVIDGIEVNMYDRDRTICDCLRYMNQMNTETFNKVIQNYIKDPKKNIPNLIEYAKVLRVSKKAKDLIGVWL